MTDQLSVPPILSTPDSHIFEDPTPPATSTSKPLTVAEVNDVYEIARTAEEIRAGGWRRIALQFSDAMLCDAPKVFEALERSLHNLSKENNGALAGKGVDALDDVTKDLQAMEVTKAHSKTKSGDRVRLFILADTSYGACCVDEVAAEHVDAEVVVHYGRSCLSPTARLPVIYVFTSRPLTLEPVIAAFEETFPEKSSNVVLDADITYSNHVPLLFERLKSLGYTNTYAPSVIHDPSSPIPNRTLPPQVTAGSEELNSYSLFHISDPPASLLLTLSSRLRSLYIYPTAGDLSATPKAIEARTSLQLRRRYALLTSLTTCPIFGILINTLSVRNYLDMITKIRAQIAAAGKKSYTFVVGKINAAKIANFSEIGGWVVVGCWESSLIENRDFYRPVITPFELGLALMKDEERLWTGEWTGDFSSILRDATVTRPTQENTQDNSAEIDDDKESAPPEFDLRTGRYVSHSRPMRIAVKASLDEPDSRSTSKALMLRARGDMATIDGTASPGAEYLRSQRTWTGLGSDFEVATDEKGRGGVVEQGRRGVARGYTVGEDEERR